MTTRASRSLFSLFAVLLLLPILPNPASAQQIATSDLDAFTWHHVGPWTFSGRISAISVPEGQNDVYYVGAASGGVWKSENKGISFKPIFENYGNMSIGYIAVAPSNHDIVYVATGEAMHARSSSHGNGVYKSTDGGETFTHLSDLRESHYINKIAIHPQNPDILYVACEGKLYSNEMDCERGLYKSTNGGESFQKVWDVDDRGVGDFVMDPNNPDVIIAHAYKTYRRSWTYIDRQEGNWLYKTTDGGRTWRRLENGLPLDVAMGRAGLAMYAKDPNIVYARLDELVNLGLNTSRGRANYNQRSLFRDGFYWNKWVDFQINSQIARQTRHRKIAAEDAEDLANQLNALIEDEDFLQDARVNLDRFNQTARQAFADDQEIIDSIDEIEKLLATPEGEGPQAAGRSQAINRYVLQTIYGGALAIMGPTTRAGVVFKSEDQGETWTRMTEYLQMGGSQVINQTEAGYYGRLEVDPNDPDILYACNTRVVKSTDGGKTFQGTNWYSGKNRLHVDTRCMWVDPLDSDHILNGNDGGLGETWDGGAFWHQKDRIASQQFYDVSVDDEQPYNVMGGTQDNGAWFGPSRNRNSYGVYPSDWTYLPTGDAYYVLRDWWNPEWIYFESQFGGSSRMNFNTGQSQGLSRRNTLEERNAGRPAQRYQWDAPIVLSPHNPGIVYVCSQHVWRSESRGEQGTWQEVSPDLTRFDPARQAESKKTNMQYATVYTFAESSIKPGVYWAGTDDGNLQLSTDYGKNWTNITFQFWNEDGSPKSGTAGARIPFDHWVVRVTPSAHELGRCYVAWSGYRTHDEDTSYIFVTEDFGKTWKDLSGGMENPVNDIVEDPDNPEVLYLATDYGLFVSVDRGGGWTRMQGQVGRGNQARPAPDVIIMDIDIQERERDLAIGTYGRGIYLTDIQPFKEMNAEVLARDAHLFEPQRVINWRTIERRGPTYGEFAWVENPRPQGNLYYYLKEDVDKVELLVKDLEGNQFAAITGAKEKGLHLRSWNLRRARAAGQGGSGAGSVQRRPGGGGGGAAPVGVYRVTLMVNDVEVMTQTLRLEDDPLFR
jgi:photosystem II stability/assembly factor-like uncharacterized protein